MYEQLQNLDPKGIMDYYRLLEIKKPSSPSQIKKAYYRLSLRYHPDRPGGDAQRFKEISEAYQVLSDPEKKKEYDRFGTIPEKGMFQNPWDIFQHMAESLFDQWEYADDVKKLWKMCLNGGTGGEGKDCRYGDDIGDKSVLDMLECIRSKIPTGQEVNGLLEEYNQFYRDRYSHLEEREAEAEGSEAEGSEGSEERESRAEASIPKDSCSETHGEDIPEITIRVKVEEVLAGVVKKLDILDKSYYIPTNVARMKSGDLMFRIIPVWEGLEPVWLHPDGDVIVDITVTLHEFYYGRWITLWNNIRKWIPGTIERGVEVNSPEAKIIEWGEGPPSFTEAGKKNKCRLRVHQIILPDLDNNNHNWMWSQLLSNGNKICLESK